MSCYQFLDAEQAHYPVTLLCRVLGVVRSDYYTCQHHDGNARTQANQALTIQICSIHDQRRVTYGAPSVHVELPVRCRSKRVAGLTRGAS